MNHVSGYKPKKGITRRQFLKGARLLPSQLLPAVCWQLVMIHQKQMEQKKTEPGETVRKNEVLKCLLSRLKKVRLRKK